MVTLFARHLFIDRATRTSIEGIPFRFVVTQRTVVK